MSEPDDLDSKIEALDALHEELKHRAIESQPTLPGEAPPVPSPPDLEESPAESEGTPSPPPLADSLPVESGRGASRRVVGLLMRSEVMRRYRQELLRP